MKSSTITDLIIKLFLHRILMKIEPVTSLLAVCIYADMYELSRDWTNKREREKVAETGESNGKGFSRTCNRKVKRRERYSFVLDD